MSSPMTASRLADELRGHIERGDYSPGDMLPSQRALMAQHNIARNTAASAIDTLATQGLVTIRQGKGAWVREAPRLLRFGADRYSPTTRQRTGMSPFRAEVIAQGGTPSVDCTSIERTTAPPHVAERLQEPDPLEAVRRENWYFKDGEPIQFGVTWIPWTIAANSPLGHAANTGTGSIYARFSELGHEITIIREEVHARMPSPYEQQHLAIPTGSPVLIVTHTGYNQDGNPFEVTIFTMRADTSSLDYTMKVTTT